MRARPTGHQDKITKQALTQKSSHIPPTFLSLLNIEKAVEYSRQELALRPDFCLRDIFNLLDEGHKGALSYDDFYELMVILQVRPTIIDDIRNLFKTYDLDEDGWLTYSEFGQMLCPRDPDHRRILRKRGPKKNIKGARFTIRSVRILFIT